MAGTPQQRHIFISYRRQEPDKSFALKLADDLRAAGHPIWMDVEGIEGAETWTDEIQRAIQACYAYVIILSPDSLASRWVRKELLYTLGKKPGRVYPVMFRQIELPVELVDVQHVDFQGDYEAAIARLLRDLPQPPRLGPRLPQDVEMALGSQTGTVRWGAVAALIDIAHGDDPEVAPLAREQLEHLAHTDPDDRVRASAQSFFDEEAALRQLERARQAREITPKETPAPTKPEKKKPAPTGKPAPEHIPAPKTEARPASARQPKAAPASQFVLGESAIIGNLFIILFVGIGPIVLGVWMLLRVLRGYGEGDWVGAVIAIAIGLLIGSAFAWQTYTDGIRPRRQGRQPPPGK